MRRSSVRECEQQYNVASRVGCILMHLPAEVGRVCLDAPLALDPSWDGAFGNEDRASGDASCAGRSWLVSSAEHPDALSSTPSIRGSLIRFVGGTGGRLILCRARFRRLPRGEGIDGIVLHVSGISLTSNGINSTSVSWRSPPLRAQRAQRAVILPLRLGGSYRDAVLIRSSTLARTHRTGYERHAPQMAADTWHVRDPAVTDRTAPRTPGIAAR